MFKKVIEMVEGIEISRFENGVVLIFKKKLLEAKKLNKKYED